MKEAFVEEFDEWCDSLMRKIDRYELIEKKTNEEKQCTRKRACVSFLCSKKYIHFFFFFTYIMEHILIGGHTMLVRGTTPSFTFLLPEFDVSIDPD